MFIFYTVHTVLTLFRGLSIDRPNFEVNFTQMREASILPTVLPLISFPCSKLHMNQCHLIMQMRPSYTLNQLDQVSKRHHFLISHPNIPSIVIIDRLTGSLRPRLHFLE